MADPLRNSGGQSRAHAGLDVDEETLQRAIQYINDTEEQGLATQMACEGTVQGKPGWYYDVGWKDLEQGKPGWTIEDSNARWWEQHSGWKQFVEQTYQESDTDGNW